MQNDSHISTHDAAADTRNDDILIYVDGEVVNLPDLVVPHPRWRDRAFVMIPLGELAPDLLDGWVDPDEGEVRNVGLL